jgi:hypothetical protein
MLWLRKLKKKKQNLAATSITKKTCKITNTEPLKITNLLNNKEK